MSDEMALRVRICILTSIYFFFLLKPGLGQDLDEDDGEYHQYIQEFFFTEAVYSQEKKELQFTLSNYYQQQNEVQLLVEYGFTDRLQMEVELSNITNKGQGGYIGELGFLYNVLNNSKTSISLATNAGIEKETGDEFETGTETSWEVKTIFSRHLGIFQAHVDLGAELSDEETGWAGNVAFLAPLGRIKGILEVNSVFTGNANWQVTPGFILSTWKRSELALGMPIPLYDTDRVLGLVARLTIEFEGDKD